MTPSQRLTLLVLLAIASVAVTAWVWIEKHDLIWPALLGTVPLLKKLFAWKTLGMLLKKLPWFLFGGIKKYLIKIIGSITTVHVGLRFPWVRRQIDSLKARSSVLVQRLQVQWKDMGFVEKSLLIAFSVALAALVIVLIVLSKSLQVLTLRKGGETTAEQLVKRSVPQSVNRKIETLSSDKPSDSKTDTS